MPVLKPPKLPKLTPGKPLDPQQREELLALQQQIQAQLMQQRVLVDSIRQMPQFRDLASSLGATDREHTDVLRSLRHLVAPDPAGDTPLDDPEGENSLEGDSKPSNLPIRETDEISNSTLGTTTKVYVSYGGNSNQPEARKDEFSSLLGEELMKRGGVDGEDTGEPSIERSRDQETTTDASKQSASAASKLSGSSKNSRKIHHSPGNVTDVVAEEFPSPKAKEETATAFMATSRAQSRGLQNVPADSPSAPRRPMPSPPPFKERSELITIPTLNGFLEPADISMLGTEPPSRDEKRWIEAAVRRMFRSLSTAAIDNIIEAFRQWKLPACAMIVKQQSAITTGPGLCILFGGVVDVLHRPLGSQEYEKVCTYDRCGQCFGELELFYDAPRGSRSGRKLHWATIATRTPVMLWVVSRDTLRGAVPGPAARSPGESEGSPCP